MTTNLIGDIENNDFNCFKNSVAMIIVRCDAELSIVSANDVAFMLIGYSREEFKTLGDNCASYFIHPEDRAQILGLAKKQLLANTPDFTIMLRIKDRDGDYNTKFFNGMFFIKDGFEHASFSTVGDVNKLYNSAELGNMQDFIFKATNLTEDSFFEYNIKEDIMVCSEKFSKRFGVPDVIENFADIVRNSGLICSDSRKDVSAKQLQKVSERTVSKKIHMCGADGKDYWYMVYYRVFGDLNNVPNKVVGKMNDITAEQWEIEKLTKLSLTDPLTGLYNKSSIEHFIKETLKEDRRSNEEYHALMIVDIDNFKLVNDNLGHLFGDALLAQLADKLKSIFRSDDLIGRIGGDEFFVFLKKCNNDDIIASKAREICAEFLKTFEETGFAVNISASIGIVKSPEYGTTFESLYSYADVALYHVKAKGKNGFAFYDKTMGKSNYTSQRTELDSELQGRKIYSGNRSEFYFNMLFDSKNLPSILPSVIKLLTEQYDFCKGYIFEYSAEHELYEKTYSYDNVQVLGESFVLNEFRYTDFEISIKEMLDKGFVFIPDTSKHTVPIERAAFMAAEMWMFFAVPMIEMGELVGMFGFEQTKNARYLSVAEIEEIKMIMNIINTFLIKFRLEQKISENNFRNGA